MLRKFTIEHIKDFCKQIGVECLSDEYIGIKEHLELICPRCNEIYKRNFDNIKNRKNPLCSDCAKQLGGIKQAFSFEYVKHFVELESESGCELLSDTYINTDSKLEFKCCCGNIFSATFYKFKNCSKRQCNECGLEIIKNKMLTPLDEIIAMVKDENYKFIKNKADGGDQKMLVQCPHRHTPYWVNVAKFKMGQRCPHCSRSLGEELISKRLDSCHIEYEREYTFKDLIGVGGGLLRYDFALFDNGEIIKLIEYDGKQHFEIAFDDESQFIRTQQHDSMKNEYAQDNNIPLLRIPYTEYENIPNIIEELINKYKI